MVMVSGRWWYLVKSAPILPKRPIIPVLVGSLCNRQDLVKKNGDSETQTEVGLTVD